MTALTRKVLSRWLVRGGWIVPVVGVVLGWRAAEHWRSGEPWTAAVFLFAALACCAFTWLDQLSAIRPEAEREAKAEQHVAREWERKSHVNGALSERLKCTACGAPWPESEPACSNRRCPSRRERPL